MQNFLLRDIKLIILDRDGVINHDSPDYIKSPEEFYFIEKSCEAIALLHQAGLKIAVATNQSGIARGYYDIATLERIHQKMREGIERAGGSIHWIEYCPHHPKDGCLCRKPQPGMLKTICQTAGISPEHALMIGDKPSDIEAAFHAGMKGVWISHEETSPKRGHEAPWAVFPDLYACVHALL